MQPQLAIRFDSSAGASVLGAGFSIAGLPGAITRCPSNLAQDGEIREVRGDSFDKLCLDQRRLVVVKRAPEIIELRTVPDTFVRVIGHYPPEQGTPAHEADAVWFEAVTPSGITIEYGTSSGTKPLARTGVPRAWLAAKRRDGRGNTAGYGYCFADAGGYVTEFALDQIEYTGFEGSPALEPTRAIRFVYGTKDPRDVHRIYSGGIALQSSLSLEEVQMIGPGSTLVRSYGFTYDVSATTNRTLLMQVEECATGGVCKPPTRFQYKSGAAGFKTRATSIPAPVSRRASPMLADLSGDGLPELIVPDMDEALSTPFNPITQWLVAQNRGPKASPAYFASAVLGLSQDWVTVATPSAPADPAEIQPELGTALDYDQDGSTDIFLHSVYGSKANWQVLLRRSGDTLDLHDTGIARPFPLGVSPAPPMLTSAGGSAHLADVSGDGVPDLIQCNDHSTTPVGDPSKPVWMLHLWKPAQGLTAAGFDVTGEPIEPLAGFRCDTEFFTQDITGDSRINLIVPAVLTFSDGTQVPASTYSALARRSDGSWEVFDTKLPVVKQGGRVVFVDVNADKLPDAVESGFDDHALRTYMNTGRGFVTTPVTSLGDAGLGDQDTYFRLAAPIDFNNDGRLDLLMPVPPGTLHSGPLPAWVILEANAGLQDKATFTLVDPLIPFEAEVGDAITLADLHGPRIGDMNGDGAADIVMVVGGVFQIFENQAADQDVLIAVSDGMNAHDPEDPGFVPNVSISYGHMIDASITDGVSAGDPKRASYLYLSQADPANGCDYPRTCAVGPRRVVSGYAINNGADSPRHFSVRFRDGRYHRGRGFLGFAKRIITELDTGESTADWYDNITYFAPLKVFPFAGQVQRRWHWQPGLPSQPKPDQIELSFVDVTRTVVPTNGGETYFTMPTERRMRQKQGIYPPMGNPAQTVEAYVAQVEAGGGATMLRDTTAKVTDFDEFGNVLAEDVSTVGIDLTLDIKRTYKNDTDRWVLGQLQTQKSCSTGAMQSQCRLLARTTTIYGEVETESIWSDDNSPDTKLDIAYERDDFGNIRKVTAKDAYGHDRSSAITFDAAGIFPEKHINAAGHTTLMEFDPAFGVLTKLTDPNGLVTARKFDGFGRFAEETRPDGTQTTVTLSRTKDGGAWRVRQTSTTTGGADDEVELDSLGRPIRWWWHGPDVGGTARLMQEIAFDARGEFVARRSVPVSEATPANQLLFDRYEHDAAGRQVRHTTPWNAVTQTSHEGLLVRVTDPLANQTITQQDPLGRPVTITDASNGITSYTYGPFGALYTVTDPGGALTRMTRDAFGRVRQLDDPDRGTTFSKYDGFGELVSSTDALGRASTFELDPLGRTKSRVDQVGGQTLTTTWTWDTAANGIGKLHTLASPDGKKTYSYTSRGQLETLVLAIKGESNPLQATLGYDGFSRVASIAYPTPAGESPFVVAQEHDAYGHVLAVRDSATKLPYWQLTEVDNAGRFRTEMFGNNVSTERSYFPDKQALKSIVTEHNGATVQNLAYDYDARLSLKSRTDALQPQNPTERFRYDPLERLTCAYFSPTESASVPCAYSYDYAPNGNLIDKSDIGSTLAYTDPLHPHAVTGAGGDSFTYDAVGNQVTRPGATLTYTPFDLPETITQAAGTITFAYDGDEERIRKTTPDKETLYFGNLYERVTSAMTAVVEHRYYVQSPERVVAIVTRGGPDAGTRYLHVDNLGSVDGLTRDDGTVEERRSYDPFGQRRNPIWGQPPPMSFTSKTTQGFTGHESDEELGLVNMKGRIYDPKVGRFLTTDPIVSAPLSSGQSWNPFTYVGNNPLNFVDPSGFEPDQPPIMPIRTEVNGWEVTLVYPPRDGGVGPPPPEKNDEGEKVGAYVPPVDVSPTGNTAMYDPQPVTSAPEDWRQHPAAQFRAGMLGGVALGVVPFAGVGEQLLDAADVLPQTQNFRTGVAIGQIFGGLAGILLGATGEIAGGFLTTTGIGAAIGVPAIVVSTTLIVGGIGNIAAGFGALMRTGAAGSSGPAATPAAGGTGRPGRQERLKEIANDPNTSRADRGWIQQEQNAIERGNRKSIRTPPGKDLAHTRGREAAKGYSHTESPSNLQDRDLHRTQHKFDDFGRKNKERP